MTKKDYQLFAEVLSQVKDEGERVKLISFLEGIFKTDNPRFDIDRFKKWIYRRQNNLSMKGMRYNPKYMPLGVA